MPEPDTDLWQRLCDVLRPQLSLRDQWLFAPESRGRVSGVLDGDCLRICAGDAFTRGSVEKIKDLIARAASQLLGRPVRLAVAVRGEASGGADAFDRLLKLGREHPDIVHIQD